MSNNIQNNKRIFVIILKRKKEVILILFLIYKKYENNTYNSFMNIYFEKKFKIFIFKVKIVYKNVINIREFFFPCFYSTDDIN